MSMIDISKIILICIGSGMGPEKDIYRLTFSAPNGCGSLIRGISDVGVHSPYCIVAEPYRKH